jgi:hypothetical protein
MESTLKMEFQYRAKIQIVPCFEERNEKPNLRKDNPKLMGLDFFVNKNLSITQ